jgi:hypothetical protein
VQKAAAAWLKSVHTDFTVNATLGPFLDTLPALGEVLSPEMWPLDLIPELQAPDSLVGI